MGGGAGVSLGRALGEAPRKAGGALQLRHPPHPVLCPSCKRPLHPILELGSGVQGAAQGPSRLVVRPRGLSLGAVPGPAARGVSGTWSPRPCPSASAAPPETPRADLPRRSHCERELCLIYKCNFN